MFLRFHFCFFVFPGLNYGTKILKDLISCRTNNVREMNDVMIQIVLLLHHYTAYAPPVTIYTITPHIHYTTLLHTTVLHIYTVQQTCAAQQTSYRICTANQVLETYVNSIEPIHCNTILSIAI